MSSRLLRSRSTKRVRTAESEAEASAAFAKCRKAVTIPPRILPSEIAYELVVADAGENFTCSICKEIWRNPIQHTEKQGGCSTTFCGDHYEPNNKKCPICRKFIERQPAETALINESKKMLVHCTVCEKIMKYGEFDKHYKQECRFTCLDIQCVEVITGAEQYSAHVDVCPEHIVKCRGATAGCMWNGKRKCLSTHQAKCDILEYVDCSENLQSMQDNLASKYNNFHPSMKFVAENAAFGTNLEPARNYIKVGEVVEYKKRGYVDATVISLPEATKPGEVQCNGTIYHFTWDSDLFRRKLTEKDVREKLVVVGNTVACECTMNGVVGWHKGVVSRVATDSAEIHISNGYNLFRWTPVVKHPFSSRIRRWCGV